MGRDFPLTLIADPVRQYRIETKLGNSDGWAKGKIPSISFFDLIMRFEGTFS
jgi:hypothetical protein